MRDAFGREIVTTTPPGGGVRYASVDGSISTALRTANDNAALAIFNANPPPHLQEAATADTPEGDDLLTKIEALSEQQRKRLKRALLKIQS